MIDKKSLEILKNALPIGYGSIISKRLVNKKVIVHTNYCYSVLRGDKFNEDIITEAFILAEETKSKLLQQKQRAKQLVKS